MTAATCHCGCTVEPRDPDPWEGLMDGYCYDCSLNRCDCYPDECPVKYGLKRSVAIRWEPSETDRNICQDSYWQAERKIERAKSLLGIRAHSDAARELKSAASDLLVAAERLEKP